MKLDVDDFELFALPRQFGLEREALDARWKTLQAEVHPDRFAVQGAGAQRAAMQWAVRVNEAYQRLKDPLKRAAYLCELHGAPIRAESNTAMPRAFLVQQMEWREALDEASGLAELERLAEDVAARRREMLASLQQQIDQQQDHAAAAEQVRALMFVERFAEEVDRKLEVLAP
ncbi:Fe-S protein assembly co-chaperone HscB [Aquabacterium sp. A7-Y]|uniref:Fe-S protein assembly co-chaperone HscB n=1 Tax=Aquabacterium sp. A7-Y TaxID=1349605 RepID=UPI00223DF049|nr:Fe-S protein assembly co-chaperone HscB [Aquabacterium sp. A7-Y]MCW7537544.1 Fe-S protein assembly co-chaperone HscB [Aquabacterium sp. A7-Y]